MLNNDVLVLIFDKLTCAERRQCMLVCKLFANIIHQHRLPTVIYNLYDAIRYHDEYSFTCCCAYAIKNGKYDIIENAFDLLDEHLIRLLFTIYCGNRILSNIFMLKLKYVMKYELVYIAAALDTDNSGRDFIMNQIDGVAAYERQYKRGVFSKIVNRTISDDIPPLFDVTKTMCIQAHLHRNTALMARFMTDLRWHHDVYHISGFNTFRNTCLALSMIDNHDIFLAALEADVDVLCILKYVIRRDDVALFNKLPTEYLDVSNHPFICRMIRKHKAIEIYMYMSSRYDVFINMKWHRITLEQYKRLCGVEHARYIAVASYNNDIIHWYNRHHSYDYIDYVDVRA